MNHLCISVTFLDPLFHGQGDSEPEWPPSPMRLFQALLRGSRSGCREWEWSEVKAAAFRWLESRDAPQIVAPEATSVAGYTLFVPNNDGDKLPDRQDRLTRKVAWPHRLSGGDTLHYIWPISENGHSHRSHAEVICGEARHLLSLGWGIDQVVGNGRILTEAEVAALPGRRWRAWPPRQLPGQPCRVPVSGSLDDLEAVHQSFIRRIDQGHYRPLKELRQFATVRYLSSLVLPPRPTAAFELPDGVAFRPERTASVAAMLRSLICRGDHRQDFHQQFPRIASEVFLAGHVERKGDDRQPRFSYLPLPTIGHKRADGMIRRLLIAEPFGGVGTLARWAQERLRNATLRDEQGSDQGVLLDLWRPSSARVLALYVDEAGTWSTITPVILPGFDDGKHAKAERLFLKAVAQAGILVEAIDAFALRKARFWPGAQHPRYYFTPNYLRQLSRWHVWIRFREPVPGPLAIGAGRHVGLGLFAVSDEALQRHGTEGGGLQRR